MKLLKYLFIWILIMVASSLVGVFSVYLYWDKQVPESSIVVGVIGGVVSGILVGVIHYFKKRSLQQP